jgi:hypothetical protein
MWTFLLVPLWSQWAQIDRVTGSWAVVEIWNGDTIAIPSECLASEPREGHSIYISQTQIDHCLSDQALSQH